MGNVKTALGHDIEAVHDYYFAAKKILEDYPTIEAATILDAKLKDARTDEEELREDIIAKIMVIIISQINPHLLADELTFEIRDLVDLLIDGDES